MQKSSGFAIHKRFHKLFVLYHTSCKDTPRPRQTHPVSPSKSTVPCGYSRQSNASPTHFIEQPSGPHACRLTEAVTHRCVPVPTDSVADLMHQQIQKIDVALSGATTAATSKCCNYDYEGTVTLFVLVFVQQTCASAFVKCQICPADGASGLQVLWHARAIVEKEACDFLVKSYPGVVSVIPSKRRKYKVVPIHGVVDEQPPGFKLRFKAAAGEKAQPLDTLLGVSSAERLRKLSGILATKVPTSHALDSDEAANYDTETKTFDDFPDDINMQDRTRSLTPCPCYYTSSHPTTSPSCSQDTAPSPNYQHCCCSNTMT